MQNSEIAAALDELATLYELDGAVKYRVIAYTEAARVIRQSPVSVEELALAGRATELPGIGKTLQEKIVTLVETGSIPSAERLRALFPPSLIEVTAVPGLGAKTVRRLYDELGVASLDDLRAAAEGQRIRELKGLGPKAEENVLAGLERLATDGPGARMLLSDVLPVAEQLAAELREHPAAIAVDVAGSVRRMADTCKDVDLIAAASAPAELSAALAASPLVASAGKSGESGVRVQTHNGIAIDLRIVPPESYGNLLQHFTGSAAHNVALRERAVRMGLSVSEYGITETESGEVTRCTEETGVYERLGLPYIEPELREGSGEIEAALEGALPDLVTVDQIRGDLHCHTTLSDGKDTLEAMAEAAVARGYEYLAVTDHSATHGFGDHVTPERLYERIEEVRELNERLGPKFTLLAGSEVNILPDGRPDYDDELLAELDWAIGSIHTSFRMSREAMTKRMVAAVEHPHIDCLGHPTGRKLLRREPYDVDLGSVFEAAVAAGTMIEINSNPNRRDLSEHHARAAAEAGVTIVVNTDAHKATSLRFITYGIATARRAWLEPTQIANTRGWSKFGPLRKRAKSQ